MGLGVDIVELDRVERALARWGGRLVSRLMDPVEAQALPEEAVERVRALALAVSGKEAAAKAIGTGWTRGVRWRDVVVHRDPPRIRLQAAALDWARRLGSQGEGSLRFELQGNLVVAEFRLVS